MPPSLARAYPADSASRGKLQLITPSAVRRRVLTLLTAALCCVVLASSLFWSARHPFSIGWDESDYLNQAHDDVSAFHRHGFRSLSVALLIDDSARPSAYRIFAAPLTLLLAPTANVTRLSSVALLAIALFFIYAAAKRLAGPLAAAIATIFVASSCGVVSATHQFGTEGPLFLAIALLLYFVLHPDERWWGTGIALAIGALSKLTFALIAGPVVLLELWRRPRPTIKAIALATTIALPWWALHFRAALAYAGYASNFYRHSGLEPWILAFARLALGWPLALLVLVAVLRRHWPWRQLLLPASAILPIWVVQSGSINHNMRYLAPAMLPLALCVGILLADRSRAVLAVAGGLLLIQVIFVTQPLLFPKTDIHAWDWNQVRELCRSRGIERPTVAYLGGAWALNPPQLAQPWLFRGEKVRVEKLWRLENGTINWQSVLQAADASDVVITLEDYRGEIANREDVDNQHDAEFAALLEKRPEFTSPVRLVLGGEAKVIVFFRAE
jgi:hypothetical protein